MIATYVGMFLGLVSGLLMAGPGGGVAGLVVGMALGLMWAGVTDARVKVAPDAELVREQQSILCVPRGSVADVTFVRAVAGGQWVDVDRCSLCTPENDVTCARRCLLLIRDALPRRQHAVAAAVATPT